MEIVKIYDYYVLLLPLKFPLGCDKKVIFDVMKMLTLEIKDIDATIIDAENILDKNQILIATEMALRSHLRRKMISREIHMEILLYLTGQRQIRDAINLLGINEKTKYSFLVIISRKKEKINVFKERFLKKIDGKIETINDIPKFVQNEKKILKTYDIDEKEIEATFGKNRKEKILKCIISRMNRLNIEK